MREADMTGSGDISYEELAQRVTSCEDLVEWCWMQIKFFWWKGNVQHITNTLLAVARRKVFFLQTANHWWIQMAQGMTLVTRWGEIWKFYIPKFTNIDLVSWGQVPFWNRWIRIVLLMEEILHQLMVVYPIRYRFLYIPGGAGFLPSTVGPVVSHNSPKFSKTCKTVCSAGGFHVW